jgi:hypothetical protein
MTASERLLEEQKRQKAAAATSASETPLPASEQTQLERETQ